jgi:hypothetical protein
VTAVAGALVVVLVVVVIVFLVVLGVVVGIVVPVEAAGWVVVKGLGAVEGRPFGLELGLLLLIGTLGLFEDREELLALCRMMSR